MCLSCKRSRTPRHPMVRTKERANERHHLIAEESGVSGGWWRSYYVCSTDGCGLCGRCRRCRPSTHPPYRHPTRGLPLCPRHSSRPERPASKLSSRCKQIPSAKVYVVPGVWTTATCFVFVAQTRLESSPEPTPTPPPPPRRRRHCSRGPVLDRSFCGTMLTAFRRRWRLAGRRGLDSEKVGART